MRNNCPKGSRKDVIIHIHVVTKEGPHIRELWRENGKVLLFPNIPDKGNSFLQNANNGIPPLRGNFYLSFVGYRPSFFVPSLAKLILICI